MIYLKASGGRSKDFEPTGPARRHFVWLARYQTGACRRDARLYEIGAGTSEIRRRLIGRELFEKMA